MVRTFRFLALALAAGLSLGAAAGTPPRELVTLLDYFEEGIAGSDRWLEGRGEQLGTDLRKILRDRRRTCVRVAVESRGADGQTRSMLGSGVIVEGGLRVLTAGHSLAGAGDDATIRITLRDGRTMAAVVAASSHRPGHTGRHDWALLDLVNPPAGLAHAIPAKAEVGDSVIVLGYPDRLGLDESGHAVHGFSRERAALDPLPFVARVSAANAMELTPVAGAVPVAGASGAPLFNERGELVGIFVAVGRLAYPDGLRYSYEAAPIDAVVAPPLPVREPATLRVALP